MKILLFGSSGTVGTAVEAVCQKRNIECIGLSHTDFEITNKEEVERAIKKYNPSVVINAAVINAINPCEIDPEKAFAINTIAVANLAKICNREDIILVQSSTHTIFDGKKDDYYTEEDHPNPLNIYGVSKFAAEYFAKNLCKKHYIVRLPTLFGGRRNENESLGFVDKVLKRIKEGEILRIADDKIDSFTYTIDVANTIIDMLEEKKSFGIYHIANAGKVSYYDFISKLVEILESDTRVIRAKDKDFACLGQKSLKTGMKSIKLEALRSWQDALYEYITNEVNKLS